MTMAVPTLGTIAVLAVTFGCPRAAAGVGAVACWLSVSGASFHVGPAATDGS